MLPSASDRANRSSVGDGGREREAWRIMQKAAFEFQSAVCSKWPFFAGHWNAVRLRIREKGVACFALLRERQLCSHNGATVRIW